MLVCRPPAGRSPLDRPANDRSANGAAIAVLDPPHALSEAVHIHSAKQISPDLQHAVIAAEDVRFYQHHGFDWHELEIAAKEDLEGDRTRGASTLTEQLVKNLFFGTSHSILRKAAEYTLVPVAEFVLGKRRILELYLNVIEWGPGIYGADAACRRYYKTQARTIGRQEAARLAASFARPPKATSRSHEPIQRDHLEPDAPDGLVNGARPSPAKRDGDKTAQHGAGKRSAG